jgi:DNA repair protein RecO (recombination protein O)
MSLIRTQGIIIGEVDTGESDKILTIFTKKYGKIQASVKGARRPRSNLMACSQILVFSDFIFYKGKEIYSVNTCDIVEPFYNIRSDIVKLTYATYFTEIINYIVHENLPSYRVLQLFLNALFTLSETDKPPELIARVFELRLMAIIGYKPYVDSCANCYKDKTYSHFSIKNGGLICEDCQQDLVGCISLSDTAIKAMRYILKADIKKIFSFNASELILKELKLVSLSYITDRLEKEFQTLKFLEKVNIKR